MKLGTVSAIAIATPVALGASGFFLTKEGREMRINDAMKKASSQIRKNEQRIELLQRLKRDSVVPAKKIDFTKSKKGIVYHMSERKRVNGCSYKIKVNNQEHDLDRVLNSSKSMNDPAGRAYLELSVTKDWRKWGEGIVNAACFRAKNVTVERQLSPTWKGWHYWWVIGKDENGKEVYRDWFWQK